jgi:hypothetical protein
MYTISPCVPKRFDLSQIITPIIDNIHGDYHQEMNSVVFLEWFEKQLMPALKNPSLVVLDNASYHNVKTEDTVCLYFSQKKTVLQNYLTPTKPLTCAHINSLGLSSKCRTGVLNTSCPCKLAILSVL